MRMIMSDGIEKWRQIGDRLRKAREYLELKQEEAAEAVGLSRSALSLVENGRRKVDAVELARFAEVYRQSIEALTGAAETPPLPESVQALARAATELSVEDRDELLRFAEFLQTRSPRGASRG
jgi:transcriptional regulator with XRE-family HTH domain